VLQRSRLIAQLTVIALTYKIEAAGSWWVGGIMVSVFLYVLVVLDMCAHIYHSRYVSSYM
jgi:hypothetical protein